MTVVPTIATVAAPHRFSYVLGEAFQPQGHLVEGGDAGAGVLPSPPRLQSFLHLYHERPRAVWCNTQTAV